MTTSLNIALVSVEALVEGMNMETVDAIAGTVDLTAASTTMMLMNRTIAVTMTMEALGRGGITSQAVFSTASLTVSVVVERVAPVDSQPACKSSGNGCKM